MGINRKPTLQQLNRVKELRRCVTDGFEAVDLCLAAMVQHSMQALAESAITSNALSEIKSILPPKQFKSWCSEHIKSTLSVNVLLKLHRHQRRGMKPGESQRQTAYRLLGLLVHHHRQPALSLPQTVNALKRHSGTRGSGDDVTLDNICAGISDLHITERNQCKALNGSVPNIFN